MEMQALGAITQVPMCSRRRPCVDVGLMSGAAVRRLRPEFEQVIVVRRDLGLKFGVIVPLVSRAAFEFVFDRVIGSEAPGANLLTSLERDWLTGRRPQRYLRVHSELQLVTVVQAAREAGLGVHVVESTVIPAWKGQQIPVCCAIGPAATGEIESIVGQLTLW